MKVVWLGQSGLLFVSGTTKIMIDPYLTDSLAKENHEFVRGTKINKKLFKVKPDALILTNNHSDHADIGTIEKIIKHRKKRKRLLVLSCESVFNELIDIPTICQANHIMLESGSEWTIGNLRVCAVSAKTDDKTAIGVVIVDTEENKSYYVASDTLYNKKVLADLPSKLFASFLPINGEFGSMNLTDAKRFANELHSDFLIPVHFGMFDNIDPKGFDFPNAIIPKAYKIISFNTTIDNQSYKKGLDFRFNEKDGKKTPEDKKNDTSKSTNPVIMQADNDGAGVDKDDKNPIIIENIVSEEEMLDTSETEFIPYDVATKENNVDNIIAKEQLEGNKKESLNKKSESDTNDDNNIADLDASGENVDIDTSCDVSENVDNDEGVVADEGANDNENIDTDESTDDNESIDVDENVDDEEIVDDEKIADDESVDDDESVNGEDVDDEDIDDEDIDDEDIDDEGIDDEEDELESDDIPFEEGNWSELLGLDVAFDDDDEENEADENEEIVDDESDDEETVYEEADDEETIDEDFEDEADEDSDDLDELVDDDDSDDEDEDEKINIPIYYHDEDSDDETDKIDAYIREIEKFERGETADFSKIE